MRRWLLIVVGIVISVVLAMAIVLLTGPGLRLAWDVAVGFVPGQASLSKIEGQLIGPIRIHGLQWQNGEQNLQIDNLTIDWQLRPLLSRHLQIDALRAGHVQWQDNTVKDPEPQTPFSLPSLPLWITADQVDVDRLTVTQADSRFELQRIALAGRVDDDAYQVDRFAVSGDSFSGHGKASINLSPPNLLTVESSWTGYPPDPQVDLQTSINLGGSLQTLKIDVATTGAIEAQLNGQLADPFDELVFDGTVAVQRINPALTGLSDDAVTANIVIHATSGQVAVNGHLTAPSVLPHTVDLDGGMLLQDDGQLQLNATRVSFSGLPPRVELSGTIDPRTRDVSLNVQWQDLAWPIEGPPQWRSASGKGTLTGTLDDYRFDFTGGIANPDIPPLQFAARGSGTTEGVVLDRLRAMAPGSDERLVADGRVAWTEHLTANLNIEVEKLDARRLNSSISGSISATTRLAVRAPPAGLVADIELLRLQGDLNGRQLSGDGKLRIGTDSLQINALQLRAGQAVLQADGNLGEQMNLSWTLDIPALDVFVPELSGSVISSGKAAGSRQDPRLDGSLRARDFSANTLSIAVFDAEFTSGLGNAAELALKATADDVLLSGKPVGDATLDITGGVGKHELNIAVDGPDRDVQVALTGGLDEQQWRGTLDQLRVTQTGFQPLTLVAQAPLQVSASSVSTTQLCLQHQASSLCVDGALGMNDRSQMQFTLASLPLATFALLLPPGLDYEGDIEGEGFFTLASGAPTGRATLSLQQGQVITHEDGSPETLIAYENGRIDAALTDDYVDTQVHLDLRDAGSIDMAVKVPVDPHNALNGRIDLRIANLSLVPALVPSVARVKGLLTARLNVAGTLHAPDLSGQVEFAASELVLPEFGLNLADTRLTIVTQANEIKFDGETTSGPGALRLDGELRWQDGMPAGKLQLAGDRFRAIDLPEVWLEASPELELVIDEREIVMRGEVLIPAAQITPIDLDRGVQVSSDQVIIGENAKPIAAPEPQWRINGNMLLTAGDNVKISGYGLEGRLTGSVRIIDQPGKPTTARGTLEIVDGGYEAYGQKLAIEKGKLEFTGGTLDDPGLDLRAARKSGEIVAGVQVRGALRKPTITLYSSPPMSDTQSMSYLVTGRRLEDLDQDGQAAVSDAATRLALQSGGSLLANSIGRGLGLDSVQFEDTGTTASTSLIVGKQLSPRLFVSYGIGLFEAINTLRLRYRINNRLTLVTESGDRTSADLLYSFER